MPLSNQPVCPHVQVFVARETIRLQSALTRTFRGLDASVAAKAIKDAVASDLIDNAGSIAKAASEGIGADFTQKLVKGVIDQVLSEISFNFPETRDIVSNIKIFGDLSFSMIQMAITLADNSPLVMASRSKRAWIETVNLRSSEIVNLRNELQGLIILAQEAESRTPIGQVMSKVFTSVSSSLDSASMSLERVEAGLVDGLLQIVPLGEAKEYLRRAMVGLSPLDETMSRTAITTNPELIELLEANFGDGDIINRLLASNGLHSFNFDEASIKELTDAGMSSNVKTIFLSLKGTKSPADPDQILFAKIKAKIATVNNVINKVDGYSVAIPNILAHFFTVKEYLEEPKPKETNARNFYDSIVKSANTRVVKLAGLIRNSKELLDSSKRPADSDLETTNVDEWIAEIASIMAMLDMLKQGMYAEKRLNANPANTIFYNAYEDALACLKRDRNLPSNETFSWDDAQARITHLGFSLGIVRAQQAVAFARQTLGSKSIEDIKNLGTKARSAVLILDNEVEILEAREADVWSCLQRYSPEPSVPRLFELLDTLLSKMGFDRMADRLIQGDIKDILNCSPELASYAGAAAKCLRDKAAESSNDSDRSKFEKAAIDIDRENRTRFLGDVNVSTRSIQSIRSLQVRLEEIAGLLNNVLGTGFEAISGSELAGPLPQDCTP